MTNENHQKQGNGPQNSCGKSTAKEEAKTESKTGHDLAKALIASKNSLKAPMEKAQKKNKKGECIWQTGAAFSASF